MEQGAESHELPTVSIGVLLLQFLSVVVEVFLQMGFALAGVLNGKGAPRQIIRVDQLIKTAGEKESGFHDIRDVLALHPVQPLFGQLVVDFNRYIVFDHNA